MQSTRIGLLALCFILSACASVPLPFKGDGQQVAQSAPENAASNLDEADSDAGDLLIPAVPTPSLQAGSQALFDRGVELLKDNNLDAAQVMFQELAESQPELAGPWVNLGHIALARDDVEQAQHSFELALQANPANCDALTQLGVMVRKQGEFALAQQYYQRCIDANPAYANAYLNLGILYELYMGRLPEALAAYNDYQTMLPSPNQQVAGWVMDLERRVAAIARR
ncbi:MAG: tetratricopeptide repeat protein [bacterium]